MQYKKITYIQYTNPAAYPPLQHSSRIFAKAGWKVLFLGTGSRGESNSFEFPPHENIIVKRWKYYNPGIVQKLHYIIFSFWSAFIAWWSGSSWVYASDMMACLAAIIARNIFRLKIIYHEHDSPNRDSQKESLFIKFLLRCRKYLAQKAEIVIFPNADRAKLYQEETGRKWAIDVVWNVPAIDEIFRFDEVIPKENKLFFHGSLNKVTLPESILDALLKIDNKIVFEFAGYSTDFEINYIDLYLNKAKEKGLSQRVIYKGCFSRQQLLYNCGLATIGLALFPVRSDNININFLFGASNKVFDYLASGLILIVSNGSDWVRELSNKKLGHCCDPNNCDSIAEAISKIVSNVESSKVLQKNAENILRKEWNYEKQFTCVLNKVNIDAFNY